jgi:hypothetical protein
VFVSVCVCVCVCVCVYESIRIQCKLELRDKCLIKAEG